MSDSCDGRHECHAPAWPTGPGQTWRCPECGRVHESFAVTREAVSMPDRAWSLIPPDSWGWRSLPPEPVEECFECEYGGEW